MTLPPPIPAPVPAATPDNLVRLQIANLERLKAIEAELGRLAGESDRLERRFTSTESRVVGLADHLSLMHMHLSGKPHGARLFWIVLMAQAIALITLVGSLALGFWVFRR